ncbi:MAG: group I truncated hemoglobin [Hyphomicrobiaceae bacterium]
MRIASAFVTAALAVTLAHAGLAQEKKAPAAQKSLYERLGGEKAVVAVVDDFVTNVSKDKRINHFFIKAKTDPVKLKKLLTEQICQAAGGPCKYTGRDMKTAHKGMGVADKDFNVMVEDLNKTLRKLKVPAKERKELVGLLAPMKKDIVEKK